MQSLVIVVATLLTIASAGNYDSASVRQAATPSYSNSRTASILRQIHLVNEDGSYTFGYENADGSFRMENRDISGYVTGRYGYVDAYGRTQEFDYVAGNLNGRSVGYQARNSLLPVTASDASFPVVRTVASNPLFNTFNTQNIVRTVETPAVVASTPAITSSVLRTVDPAPVTLVSSTAQPAVRFVNDQSAFSLTSNSGVRFVNEQPAVSLLSNPSVRFVNDQSAVSLVSNPTVRFVNEQPAVSFISNPLASAQQQFQVLERFTLPQQFQQIQQQAQPFIIQNGRSVFGSPSLSRFVDQPLVVSRTQPVSSYGSGLRNLVLGQSNNDFRFVDNTAY